MVSEVEAEHGYEQPLPARYDLTEEELRQLENQIADFVGEMVSEPGITALWIPPTHKFSNFLRTHEAHYFPEVAEVSEDDESNTVFLALVDTRNSSKKVVHGATVMYPEFMQKKTLELDKSDLYTDGTTGFYTIDSLIERGNFTAAEFIQYYDSQGIDIAKCLSVETNFRIGERPDNLNGLKPADVAYIALYNRLIKNNPALLGAAIFATINEKQVQSFERTGLKYEPIMGRTDLKTEESELGIESLPIALIYDQYSHDLMSELSKQVTHLSVE